MTTPSSSSRNKLGRQFPPTRLGPSPTPADHPGVILHAPSWVPLGVVLLAWPACCCLPRWSAGALVGRCARGCSACCCLLQTALAAAAVFSPIALLVWLASDPCCAASPNDEWLGWAVCRSPLPVWCFYSCETAAASTCFAGVFDATALRGGSSNLPHQAPRNDRSVHLPLDSGSRKCRNEALSEAPAKSGFPLAGPGPDELSEADARRCWRRSKGLRPAAILHGQDLAWARSLETVRLPLPGA